MDPTRTAFEVVTPPCEHCDAGADEPCRPGCPELEPIKREELDEISAARLYAARARAGLQKNTIARPPFLGELGADQATAYAGIEGTVEDARIGEAEVLGGITADVVLDDDALGVYWHDENDEPVAWQLNGPTRMAREVLAVDLVRWQERHPDVELGPAILEALGFARIL